MALSLRALEGYRARFSGLPTRWRVLVGAMVAATVLTLLDVRATLRRPELERGRACGLDNEGSWSIGVYHGDSPFELYPLEDWSPSLKDSLGGWPVANPVVSCATQPRGAESTFVADPFVHVSSNGTWTVFYETKRSGSRRGEIAASASDDGGASWRHLGVVLAEPWHLSFPSLFHHGGAEWMVPEGSGSGALRVYRSVNFPTSWMERSVLVDRPLVDAAVFEHEGRWWILGTDRSLPGGRACGRIDAYYSEEGPFGPYAPHPRNPVASGSRRSGARNGGRPWRYHDRLYRLGQTCDPTYGADVVMFEVLELTPTAYKERRVRFQLARGSAGQGFGTYLPAGGPAARGASAWNGARRHHLDPVALPSGKYLAVTDGDSGPSGPVAKAALESLRGLALAWAVALALLVGAALADRWLDSLPQRGAAGPARGAASGAVALLVGRRAHPHRWAADRPARALAEPNRLAGGAGGPDPYADAELAALAGPGAANGAAHRYTAALRTEPGRRAGPPGGGAAPAPLSAAGALALLRRCARPRALRSAFLALSFALLFAAAGSRVGWALYVRKASAPGRSPSRLVPRPGGQASAFTVAIMSYGARAPMLRKTVAHYSRCSSALEVLVVWSRGVPPNPAALGSAVPVRVRVHERNSLNNRFLPDPLIRTRGVLFVDDDQLVPCPDVERAFAAWRRHPDELVGFFPRILADAPPLYRGEKDVFRLGAHNAILTGAMFLDHERYFAAYSAPAYEQDRAMVDELFNCEDILMNVVVSRAVSQNVSDPDRHARFVRPTARADLAAFGKSGLSADPAHANERSTCVQRLLDRGYALPALSEIQFPQPGGIQAPNCKIPFMGCLYV